MELNNKRGPADILPVSCFYGRGDPWFTVGSGGDPPRWPFIRMNALNRTMGSWLNEELKINRIGNLERLVGEVCLKGKEEGLTIND